jgi:acetoin:2,6-dichlorophenolindophenol oxidoreductase subunit alpha
MSSIYQLPVVYVCENNQYAMSMPAKKAFAIEKISQRAAGYGVPGVTVDGNDLFAVYEAVREAVDRARAGSGPSLVENFTYRWRGHSKSDRQLYRTREEVKEWQARDPIPRVRERLMAAGLFSQEDLDQVEQEAHQKIEDSVAFAEAAPDPNPDSYWMVSMLEAATISEKTAVRELTYAQAIREALRQGDAGRRACVLAR